MYDRKTKSQTKLIKEDKNVKNGSKFNKKGLFLYKSLLSPGGEADILYDGIIRK